MPTMIKSYTRECDGEERTIMVYYEDSKLIDSNNYIYDKSGYKRCDDCNSTDCPVYKSAPKHQYLPR